jgi:recombination protein RecA
MASPFREAEFDILYGEGISREGDLIDLAVERNILEKSGAWFSYEGERLGQGRENVKAFLRENIDIRDKIEKALRKTLGFEPKPEAAAATPASPTSTPAAPPRGKATRS